MDITATQHEDHRGKSGRLNVGQLGALRTIAKGEQVARFVVANLIKRGMISAEPTGALVLTSGGLAALADAAKAVCFEGLCTLGANHKGDHGDADGHRFINWSRHWYFD